MAPKWLKNDPQAYATAPLSETVLPPTPMDLFSQWFELALQADAESASVMCLATVNEAHQPNSRIVLMKSYDESGIIFFTNYHSTKATEINMQPHVCVNFFWFEQKRQVRIEGQARPISATESDAYFSSRPRESQLGAWASDQSRQIPSREFLEQRFDALALQYQNQDIPRPPHWGGYLIKPTIVEFWQGGDRRLHDRFQYTKQDNIWTIKRLAP